MGNQGNKPESKWINEDDKWKYLFTMIQPYGLESGIYRYYVNSDSNKIKEVPEAEDEIVFIITCPIKLDYIISYAFTHFDLHVLITWQLINVMNNMIDNCAKKCLYWNEYIKKLNDEWQSYYQSNPRRNCPFMEVQHQIHKLYNAKKLGQILS